MSEPIFPIITTDATELYKIGMERIAELVPGFDTDVVASPEAWLLEAVAEIASEVQAAASTVPEAIFLHYGQNILGIPLNEGLPAVATLELTLGDSLGHTIPEGTAFQLYLDAETAYEFVLQDDVIVPNGDSTASVDVVCTSLTDEANGAGVAGAELVDSIPYVASIAVTAEAIDGVSEETEEEYLSRLTDTLQLLSTRPITARDYEIAARARFGGRWLCLDGYKSDHNTLTVNQAGIETDTTGWAAASNCSIAKSSTQAAEGTSSLRLSSTAAGDMSATTPTGVSGEPVTAGEKYTARAEFRADANARAVDVGIAWYTAAGALIGSIDYGASTSDTTSGWTERSVTAVAPDTAAFAAVVVRVVATGGAAELHYVDKIAFRLGELTSWAAGGTVAWLNPLTVTLVGVKDDGSTFTTLELAGVQEFFDLNKMVNFVVHTMQPATQSIDVSFSISVDYGFDDQATLELAEASVSSFLSAALWGLPNVGDDARWEIRDKVRYFDLVGLLVGTVGVKSLDTLTVNGGTVDVSLPNKWTLATSGTITGALS